MTHYFAHISDTHIGPTPDMERHGHVSYTCTKRLIEILNSLPTKPDFVIHTGDVVNNPDPGAYPLAAKLFAELQLPIYFVPGNHDDSADMLQHLPFAQPLTLHPQTGKLDYTFEHQGELFLALDAYLPPEHSPHGGFNDAQLALVSDLCQPDGPPLTIFTHFPALTMNSPWMDTNMLLLNGEAFHQRLLPAQERIRGVFHGHVHQPMQTFRDGIRYICAPSAFSQFNAWPTDIDVRFDPNALPGFNFVHLLPEQTIVHTHTFLRPETPTF
ncbi:MAG: metallophosphoesterase family protein [Candidatus Promineifilaceae bacterium]